MSYGSADLLRTHLATLDRVGMRTPSLVVIVDNFRDPQARSDVQRVVAEHGWDRVLNPDNRGFGSAANQGVEWVASRGCDVVVVLNPDVAIDASTMDGLADEAGRSPRTLVTPRVVRTDGRLWFGGGSIDLRRGWTSMMEHPGSPTSDGWLTGACLVSTVSLWRDLGGFSDLYHLYWEDVDLSYRCTRSGGTLQVRQDLEVAHEVGGTQGGRKSATYQRFNCRNRLVFAASHLSRWGALQWLARAPWYAWHVLRRGGRRALLQEPSLVVAAAQGTLQGAGVVLAFALAGRRPA